MQLVLTALAEQNLANESASSNGSTTHAEHRSRDKGVIE